MYDIKTALTKAQRLSRTFHCLMTVYACANGRYDVFQGTDGTRLSKSVHAYYNGYRQF